MSARRRGTHRRQDALVTRFSATAYNARKSQGTGHRTGFAYEGNMIAIESIQEVCDRIAAEFHPERIILFGSYAYGTPAADSDVDLLVILPFRGRGASKSVEMLNRVKPTFPVDLLVRTPEEVKQRLAWNDYFLREVI